MGVRRGRQETLGERANGAKPNKKTAKGPQQSNYTFS
jgi:hypothetical protein